MDNYETYEMISRLLSVAKNLCLLIGVASLLWGSMQMVFGKKGCRLRSLAMTGVGAWFVVIRMPFIWDALSVQALTLLLFASVIAAVAVSARVFRPEASSDARRVEKADAEGDGAEEGLKEVEVPEEER